MIGEYGNVQKAAGGPWKMQEATSKTSLLSINAVWSVLLVSGCCVLLPWIILGLALLLIVGRAHADQSCTWWLSSVLQGQVGKLDKFSNKEKNKQDQFNYNGYVDCIGNHIPFSSPAGSVWFPMMSAPFSIRPAGLLLNVRDILGSVIFLSYPGEPQLCCFATSGSFQMQHLLLIRID